MGRARGKEAAATRKELDVSKSVVAEYDLIIQQQRLMLTKLEREQQIHITNKRVVTRLGEQREREQLIALQHMQEQIAEQREELQQMQEQRERDQQIASQHMAEQRQELQQITLQEMADQRELLLRRREREELQQRGRELTEQQLADSQLAEREQLAEQQLADSQLAEQEQERELRPCPTQPKDVPPLWLVEPGYSDPPWRCVEEQASSSGAEPPPSTQEKLRQLAEQEHRQLAEQEQEHLESRLAEQHRQLAEQEHLESRLAEQHLAEQQHHRAEQDQTWGPTWGQTWGTSWDSSSWSRWPPEDPGPRSDQATSSSSPKVTDQHIGFHSRGIYETTSEPLKYTKDGKIACLKCAGGYSVGCDYECCKAHCPKPLVCERHKMPTQRDISSSEMLRAARAPRRPGPGFRK